MYYCMMILGGLIWFPHTTHSAVHPCDNSISLNHTGPLCQLHAVGYTNAVMTMGPIENWVNVADETSSSDVELIGSVVIQNETDEPFAVNYTVSCAVTEQWGVTAGISATLKGEVKGVIIPIGASWETTVHASGTYGNSETKAWSVTGNATVSACNRREVVVYETNYRKTARAYEGRWERWTQYCPGESVISTYETVCDPVYADGSSSRYAGLTISQRYADPSRVPGCHLPGDDDDGDGVPNEDDPDIDGDGIPNGEDPDIDGDGVPNTQDADMDGDGKLNSEDDDIDADGVPNAQDDDMDGDGVPNDVDDDRDGDGIPNSQDDEPDGPADEPPIKVKIPLILF